jgi:hypothetical protein
MRIVACEVGESTCPEPGHMNVDEETIYVRAEDVDALMQVLRERSSKSWQVRVADRVDR